MNVQELKHCFLESGYPFYKELTMEQDSATCILYSIYTNYKKKISLSLDKPESIPHQIALEVIKFQSEELTRELDYNDY